MGICGSVSEKRKVVGRTVQCVEYGALYVLPFIGGLGVYIRSYITVNEMGGCMFTSVLIRCIVAEIY